jgi:hypothetical protein
MCKPHRRAAIVSAEMTKARQRFPETFHLLALALRFLNAVHEVRAEAELQALPIGNLYTRDHSPLLEEALNQSRERLMIISPWIKADVVDKDFLEK